MRRFVVVFIASAVILGAIVRARQSPTAAPLQTTFRAGTDLIPVDVSVLDGDRKPVRGLTAADFTVLEDGKPRAVAAFTAVDVPAAPRTTAMADAAASPAAWTRDAPHDVVANSLPAEGRLVVILFDRSIPQGQSVHVAQQIATAAIDELGPGDLAAVARSSGFGNEGRVQGFTSDRRLLLDAVQSRFQGMTVLPETLTKGAPSPVPGDNESTTDCYCGLCVYETIGQVASAMRDAPRRRKVLLFVGSSIQIQVINPSDRCFGIVKEPRERMMRDLEMANVTVHSIDPVGLFTTSPMADYNVIHPPPRDLVPARNQANQRRLDDLRVLPSHTGGRLVANTNDPARLMPAVFAESQSYYLLGFEPAAPRDGLFHRIEVKVNRRGVNVHSRSGYSVEAANAVLPDRAGGVIDDSAALAEALKGPLPRPELSVSVSVAPFPRADDRTSPVAIVLGVAVPPNGGPRRFAITVGAFDVGGRLVQIHDQTVEVPAPPKGADRVSDGLLTRLNLPPGRYEIRAAVKDEQSGAVGSVFSFADVPDTSREPFGLSGIVFRGSAAPAMSDNPLADIVPFVPTVARRFASSEIVTAYLRVRTHGGSVPVQMTARVLDTRGDVRSEQRATLAPEAFDDGEAGYSVALPLARLPAGEYLLRIEGIEGEQADRRALQEVRFAVATEGGPAAAPVSTR